jgi:hypothetical protein
MAVPVHQLGGQRRLPEGARRAPPAVSPPVSASPLTQRGLRRVGHPGRTSRRGPPSSTWCSSASAHRPTCVGHRPPAIGRPCRNGRARLPLRRGPPQQRPRHLPVRGRRRRRRVHDPRRHPPAVAGPTQRRHPRPKDTHARRGAPRSDVPTEASRYGLGSGYTPPAQASCSRGMTPASPSAPCMTPIPDTTHNRRRQLVERSLAPNPSTRPGAPRMVTTAGNRKLQVPGHL